MNSSTTFAIEVLILERCTALKLRRSDLVRRSGYKNLANDSVADLLQDCGGNAHGGDCLAPPRGRF